MNRALSIFFALICGSSLVFAEEIRVTRGDAAVFPISVNESEESDATLFGKGNFPAGTTISLSGKENYSTSGSSKSGRVLIVQFEAASTDGAESEITLSPYAADYFGVDAAGYLVRDPVEPNMTPINSMVMPDPPVARVVSSPSPGVDPLPTPKPPVQPVAPNWETIATPETPKQPVAPATGSVVRPVFGDTAGEVSAPRVRPVYLDSPLLPPSSVAKPVELDRAVTPRQRRPTTNDSAQPEAPEGPAFVDSVAPTGDNVVSVTALNEPGAVSTKPLGEEGAVSTKPLEEGGDGEIIYALESADTKPPQVAPIDMNKLVDSWDDKRPEAAMSSPVAGLTAPELLSTATPPVVSGSPSVSVTSPPAVPGGFTPYLQAARYASNASAAAALARVLSYKIPAALVKEENASGESMSRLLIGPLRPDEVGAVRVKLRNMGFVGVFSVRK